MAFDPSVIGTIGERAARPAMDAPAKALELGDLINREQISSLGLKQEKETQATYAAIKEETKNLDWSNPDDQNKIIGIAAKRDPKVAMSLSREFNQAQAGALALTREELNLYKEKHEIITGAATGLYEEALKLRAQGKSDQEITAVILPALTQTVETMKGQKLRNGKPVLEPADLKQVEGLLTPGSNVVDGLGKLVMSGEKSAQALNQHLERLQGEKRAEAGDRETKTVMVGGKPHVQLFKKSTGETLKDLGEAPPSAAQINQTAASSAPPSVRELGAWMDTHGVSLTGAGRTPAQRNQRLGDVIKANPGKSIDELGQMISAGQLDFGAKKKETQTAAAIEGRINYAVNEIQRMAPYVEDLSKKVPRGQFVPWNKLKQMGEAEISDSNLAAFRMAMTTLSNAYDVLAARGGTDMAKREENRKNFDTAQSPEALHAVLQVMQQEAQIAHSAAEASTRSTTPPAPGATAAPPPAAPGAGGAGAQDQQALAWANAHPNDPRAAAIKKRLGVP